MICWANMQVNELTKLGVNAVRVDKSSQLSDISSGRYRFGVSSLELIVYYFNPICLHNVVFMSPEAAMNTKLCQLFKYQYVKKHLVLVAIDEAHRITEWLVVCCCHSRKFCGNILFI